MCSHCGEKFSRYRTRCSADGQKVIEDLRGQTFGGRYRVRELVGVGGMDSTVWKAWQTGTERVVAIKVLPVAEEAAAKRFARGARIAANLNHPHCTVVHDYGRTEDGKLFLVMEFLSGQVLQNMLGPDGMSVRDTLHIADQVLQALEHAHAERAVHRDLKPDNLFLTRRNDDPLHVKILDFGIAKYVEEDPEHTVSQEDADADVDGFEDLVTEQRQVCGTPQYMAPEQIVGAKVDGRTDLYSLACVMYRMLTGRLPFEGKSRYELYQMHVKAAPRPFSEVRPDLSFPAGLEAAIMRALMKRPESRFSSASDMRRALEAVSTELAAPRPAAPSARVSPTHTAMPRVPHPRSLSLPVEGNDATILPEDFDPYSDTRQPRSSQVLPVRPVPVRPAPPSIVARPVVGRPPTVQAPAVLPPHEVSPQVPKTPSAEAALSPLPPTANRGMASKGALPVANQAGLAASSNEVVVPPRPVATPEHARPSEPRRASLLNAPVVRHASKASMMAAPATRAGITQMGDWGQPAKKQGPLKPLLIVGLAFLLGVGGVIGFKALRNSEEVKAQTAAAADTKANSVALFTEEQGRRHGDALKLITFSPGEEWVAIRSVPPGADIVLNGEVKGKTPSKLSFAQGSHAVILKLNGYEEQTLTLDIHPTASGRLTPEQVALVPLSQPTANPTEGATPTTEAPPEAQDTQDKAPDTRRPNTRTTRPSGGGGASTPARGLGDLTGGTGSSRPAPDSSRQGQPSGNSGGGGGGSSSTPPKSNPGVRLLDDVPSPAPARPKINLLDE